MCLGLMKLTLGTGAGEDSTPVVCLSGRLRLCGAAYWEIPVSVI